jgi:N-acetylneuraminic acid mutarotase
LDRSILVLGGHYFGSLDDSSSVEVYDVSADHWSAGVSLPTLRQQLRAASLGGKVYAIGGYQSASYGPPYLQGLDEFDPGTGLWTSKAPMFLTRARFGCAVAAGQIFAIGGENFWYQDAVEAFDPSDGAWHPKAPLPAPLSRIEAQSVNGKIYVFQSSITLEYTPENDLTDAQGGAPAGLSAPSSTASRAVSKPFRWSTVRR